jgi:hypothetical protein
MLSVIEYVRSTNLQRKRIRRMLQLARLTMVQSLGTIEGLSGAQTPDNPSIVPRLNDKALCSALFQTRHFRRLFTVNGM